MKKIFVLFVIFLLNISYIYAESSMEEQNMSMKKPIDLINEEIERNKIEEKEYQINDLAKEELEAEIYTEEDYSKDIKNVKFMLKGLPEELQIAAIKMFDRYKEETEKEKENMIKARTVVNKLIEEKYKDLKFEFVIKEKESLTNLYKIVNENEYYIEWESKQIFELENEILEEEVKNELFTLKYNAHNKMLIFFWPKNIQNKETDYRTYPIIIVLDNNYGDYFNDLEEKVNQQIKMVEENGQVYINPLRKKENK